VEDITGATRIENTIRRHGKSWKRSRNTRLVIPDQPSLSESHATNAAAPALKVVEHSCRIEPHLLTKAFGYNRDVDEGKELMRV
jgi:hypothetical protein